MDQYRNNYNDYQANNSSGDTWVYYNGELYHAGVKGMQWGKHLPGTDWWKETYNKYYDKTSAPSKQGVDKETGISYTSYREHPEWYKKTKATLQTAGAAAKRYGKYTKVLAGHAVNNVSKSVTRTGKKIKHQAAKFWRDPKKYTSEQAEKLSEFAKQAYSEARKSITNFFTTDSAERSTAYRNERYGSDTPLSHLDTFQNKQLDDAVKAYYSTKTNGSFGNQLNYWFQNAQYGIAKGVNNYLKQIGMDGAVNSFISRFSGKGSSNNEQKRKPRGGHQNNITYTLN